jgi:prevent-host-death family protein
MAQEPYPSFTSRELRSRMSEALNKVVFGKRPVIVSRRGQKIAGIVSLQDMVFLERMKMRRAEVLNRKPPEDPREYAAFAQRRFEDELHYL